MKDYVHDYEIENLRKDHDAEVCIVIMMDRAGNVISGSDGPMGTYGLERAVADHANGMAFDPRNGTFAHWFDDPEETG